MIETIFVYTVIVCCLWGLLGLFTIFPDAPRSYKEAFRHNGPVGVLVYYFIFVHGKPVDKD